MSGNSFDAFAPAENPFDRFATPKNPFDAFAPKPKPKGGPTIGDALDAQRAGLMQAIFRGGSSDENRARLRNAIPDLAKEYGANNPFERGLTDFALDTVTDPLTYETLGIGPIAKGGARLAGEALKAGKGVAAMPEFAAPLARVKPAFDGAQHFGDMLHDYFTHAGAAKRIHGQEAVDTAVGALSRRNARDQELASRMTSMLDATTKSLTPEQKQEVYAVLHGERDSTFVSEPARAALGPLDELRKSMFAVQANPSGRYRLGLASGGLGDRAADARRVTIQANRDPETGRLLAGPKPTPPDLSTMDGLIASFRRDTDRWLTNKGSAFGGLRAAADPPGKRISDLVDGGTKIFNKRPRKLTTTARAPVADFTLPENLAEFAAKNGPMTAKNYRRAYLPGPLGEKEAAADREAREIDLLNPRSGNLEHQEDFSVDAEAVPGIDEAFRRAITNASHQATAADLRDEVRDKLGTSLSPHLADLFKVRTKATGDARSTPEMAADFWRGLVNLPKTAVVGTSPRHMFNIANLALNVDPGAIPGAIRTTSKLLRDPASRYDALKPAIDLGAISPSGERSTGTIDWLERLPGVLGVAGKGMRKMNDATWAFDDAMVAQVAQRLAQSGAKTGYSAGRDARRSLVDYENTSPFTQHAKNVLPFATFNTQIPGAVFKGILRNPARAEAVNRASGGTMLGGTADVAGHKVKTYLPTSDVGQLDPPAFVRKALADPVRAALTAAGVDAHGQKRYFTYGSPINMKWLLSAASAGVPEARDLLDAIGMGTFKPRGALQTLLANFAGVGVR